MVENATMGCFLEPHIAQLSLIAERHYALLKPNFFAQSGEGQRVKQLNSKYAGSFWKVQ